MNQSNTDNKPKVDPDMTILDIISRYRETEAVFKQYDEKAGVCICCQALFDTLIDMAKTFNIDLNQLLSDLEKAIQNRE